MELRHLRYFLIVAEELSFTAAAKRCNISQPPLSQQIAALEEELGTRLFDRHSRSVKLTEAGHVFRRYALSVTSQLNTAKMEVKAVGEGRAGVVQLGTTNSVLQSGLSMRIANFRAKHPEVEIRIHELSPQDQIDRLKSGRLDISFLRYAPDESAFKLELAWKERLGIVLPSAHRLSKRQSVGIAELKSEEFVFYRLSDSAFARNLLHCCVESGFLPTIVQEVVEANTVVSLVATGLGIGFVPESIGHSSGLSYLPLRGKSPSADVKVLIPVDAKPIARRFADFARAEASGYSRQRKDTQLECRRK
jgi:DNA-binding transcriptional LysR family regulator